MSQPDIDLGAQADAVHLVWLAYQNRLDDVRKTKSWPEHDIAQKERRIAELKAAQQTLAWVKANAALIKAYKMQHRGEVRCVK